LCSTDDSSDSEFNKEYKFISNGFIISKDTHKPSEDAIFVGPKALGIADGVGGWSNYGIDSSKFSTELMINCSNEVDKALMIMNSEGTEFDNMKVQYFKFIDEFKPRYSNSQNFLMKNQTKFKSLLNPQYILKNSYEATKSCGSSTACIWTLDNDILSISNLGDSGFVLFRYIEEENSYQIFSRSHEQQHSFNAPYQLTNLPNKFKKRKLNNFCCDRPEDADLYQFGLSNSEIYSGEIVDFSIKRNSENYPDILVLGSDGLFDNIFFEDMTRMVSKYCLNLKMKTSKDSPNPNSCLHPSEYTRDDALSLSKILAFKAYQASISQHWDTPFGQKVNELIQKEKETKRSGRQFPQQWRGGKQDDISAVVAFIS